MTTLDATSYDPVAHIIQLSLSPVFLLSAIATLLATFTSRLARISDQVHTLAQIPCADDQQKRDIVRRLGFLKRRSHILDLAVILASVGGACTCASALTIFFAILRNTAVVAMLFGLFGAGIACTLCAVGAFLVEVLLASRGLRADAATRAAHLDW